MPSSVSRRTQHISRALIRQHLEAPDVAEDTEHDKTSPKLLKIDTSRQDKPIPRCVSTDDLLSCSSWLIRLCEQEQARMDQAVGDDSNKPGGLDRKNTSRASERPTPCHNESTDCPGLDTTILRRIREGRGPRDEASEDLLAAFRKKGSCKSGAETYGEIREILLSWNKHASQDVKNDTHEREILATAIETRIDLLTGFSHGSDRKQALDESSFELLRALKVLRPEIAGFQNQEHFDVLVIMWANARIAIPDMDDELKLLTMKALINEVESKSHTTNATKLSGMARSLSVARLELDSAEIERLETKMRAFEEKIRKTAVKKLIDRIKTTRNNLKQVVLEELQKLTELQMAQKWAAHTKLGSQQTWPGQRKACDQVDEKLQQVLRQQVPELDAHVHIVQSNANALAAVSNNMLSRAQEAGISLHDRHSSRLSELATANVKSCLSATITDIFSARGEAVKMLGRLTAVETYLDMMLDAAKSQYQEYGELLHLLNSAVSPSTNDDVDVELSNKIGPRRESILLMHRSARSVKLG